MMKLRVHEGSSGILSLRDEKGAKSQFIPNYDMDEAISLLIEFQQISEALHPDKLLKDNYRSNNRNWYPTMVSYLFWYFFFPFVKYRPLIEQIRENKISCHCENAGTFSALLHNLNIPQHATFKAKLHNAFLHLSNRLTALRKRNAEVVFYRFSRIDFRTVEIRAALKKMGVEVLNVGPPPSFTDILKNIFSYQPELFFGSLPSGNAFQHNYDLKAVESWKHQLFTAAIRYMETTITALQNEYKCHLNTLRPLKAHTFYGLDDINAHFFPIFFACRDHGMYTVGHQHGAYVKRHAGYIMNGINPEDFEWYDRVIVWGNYWKEKIQRDAPAHPKDRFVVGSNKFSNRHISPLSPQLPPKTILIPYEFLANTAQIGRYICAFQKNGYRVFFKPRSDEALEDQLSAYCLPAENRAALEIMTNIDSSAMAQIDIVAGSMTTLIYELLPYGKIIWYLETEYRHLEDLVEEGLAHSISLEEINSIPSKKFTSTIITAEEFFIDETMESTLHKHVILR
ncbi:MAG: hypothetical protein ABI615_01315 [Chthoniobacterales bacterium]